jgi:hypothetical protein
VYAGIEEGAELLLVFPHLRADDFENDFGGVLWLWQLSLPAFSSVPLVRKQSATYGNGTFVADGRGIYAENVKEISCEKNERPSMLDWLDEPLLRRKSCPGGEKIHR